MLVGASTLPIAELLTDFVWVFTVGTVIIALLHKRKLPSLLGFLITGLVVGPVGFGLVQDREAIDVMAQIGIVLLMFTIGLEVSLAELGRMASRVIGGGLLQIGLTTVAVAAVGMLAGIAPFPAVALGLIASASSTALVLRLLGDRGELRLPHGQLALAILLSQDFAVVVLILLLPMLALGELAATGILLAVGSASVIGAGIVIIARFVFPWVLRRVVDLRSREVFLLTSVVAVFGTAWIAEAAGLSLAVGAFLAGLVISESEFSHQMSAEVLPFRDVLNGLFFVSVGLLVDRAVLLDNALLLVGLVVGSLLLKGAIVFGTAKVFRLDTRAAILAAVALAQVGEFGLVLAQEAAILDLITAEQHSLLIAVAVVTMMLTPLAVPLASGALREQAPVVPMPEHDGEPTEDHVIVVGYGINGHNVARALTQLNVRFVIVEMNHATVVKEKALGVPIVFGDATRPALLEHLHVHRARALVACIADAAATRDLVANAHQLNPNLLIIARTRYVAEIAPLLALGADSVVPEEFETSMELVARVMRAYGAPESAIQREKRTLRERQYHALLSDRPIERVRFEDILHNVDIGQATVGSGADGMTLAQLDLRRATGTTAVAVLREGVSHANPEPNFELADGDTVVLLGDAASLAAAKMTLGGA